MANFMYQAVRAVLCVHLRSARAWFVLIAPIFCMVLACSSKSAQGDNEGSVGSASHVNSEAGAGSMLGIGGAGSDTQTGGRIETGAGAPNTDGQQTTPATCANYADLTFTRDEAFEELVSSVSQESEHRLLDIFVDADGTVRVLTSEFLVSGRMQHHFHFSNRRWTEASLPEATSGGMAFFSQRFQNIDGVLCLFGRIDDLEPPIESGALAVMCLQDDGTWSSYDMGFCTEDCAEGEDLMAPVKEMFSADHTTIIASEVIKMDDSPYVSAVIAKVGGGSWNINAFSEPDGSDDYLMDVWVRSDDDIFLVGAHASSSGSSVTAFLKHYDGTAWTEIMTVPPGVREFSAVRGDAERVYLSGHTQDNVYQSIVVSSSDLVNWDTYEASIGETTGRPTHHLWVQGDASFLVGRSTDSSDDIQNVIDVYNQGDLSQSHALTHPTAAVTNIAMIAPGGNLAPLLIGTESTDTNVPMLFQVQCP